MTLLDAFLAVLTFLWTVLTAPLAVVVCGTVLAFGSFAILTEKFAALWIRIILFAVALFLGVSIIVWVFGGSSSPVTWGP